MAIENLLKVHTYFYLLHLDLHNYRTKIYHLRKYLPAVSNPFYTQGDIRVEK